MPKPRVKAKPLTMDQGATPARKPSVSASATFSGVIPIQNGDGQATSSVAYVPVANGGETQEETFNDSPIKVKPEHFPLTDMSAELSHEDDDMLALQIELAENREHLITRKIELKRRRVLNESKASSAKGFDLSRELSLEIDRARGEETRKIQLLEQEKQQIVLESNQRIEHEKNQVVQWAKDHIEVLKEDLQIKALSEIEAAKEHWKTHFRDIMHAEITAAYNEDSQKHRAIMGSVEMRQQNQIVEYEDEFRAEMHNVRVQHSAEMHSIHNQHHQVVQNIEQNAASNHDAAIHSLRDELAIAANAAQRQEHRANRTQVDMQEAEAYCRTLIEERDEANIRAENAAGKPNLEISYLRTQLERTRETHAEEVKELRTAATQAQLQYFREIETVKQRHAAELTHLKTVAEDQNQHLREEIHHLQSSSSAVVQGSDVYPLQVEIAELHIKLQEQTQLQSDREFLHARDLQELIDQHKIDLDDRRMTSALDLDNVRNEYDRRIIQLTDETRKTREK